MNPGPAAADEAPWEERSEEFGLDFQFDGMGLSVADVEGDGILDIALSDNRAQVHLFKLNEGVATDVTQAVDLRTSDPVVFEASWATSLVDLDNDMDHDLVVAFGRREWGIHMDSMRMGMWRWDRLDQRFEETSVLLDAPPTNEMEAWRTVLPGDLDGDGTLELVFTSHVGPATIQATESNGAGWIEVQLEGPPRNPDGLGARVDLHVGKYLFSRFVAMGTEGLYSALEPRVHLGLGAVEIVDEVVVTWPDGAVTALQDVEGGRILRVAYAD